MLVRTAILKVIDHRLHWIVLCAGIGPDITFVRFFLIITHLHDGDRRFICMDHLLLQYHLF